MKPDCPICKSDCDMHILASVFSVFMSKEFEDSVIVPCYARLMFTEFTGDSVCFESLGQAYDFDVVKEQTLTCLGGDGWKHFLTRNPLSYGDQMIVFFYSGETPKISVLYFRCSDLNPYNPDIISKVCKLSENEHNHLFDILPEANTFTGLPFVTRLKMKNLAKHNMKLPNKVVSGLDIPNEGLAGLCVGNEDSVSLLTKVPYETDMDGRLIFNKFAWRAFHIEEDDLQVGQAVVITARTTRRLGTHILFVFDIIKDVL